MTTVYEAYHAAMQRIMTQNKEIEDHERLRDTLHKMYTHVLQVTMKDTTSTDTLTTEQQAIVTAMVAAIERYGVAKAATFEAQKGYAATAHEAQQNYDAAVAEEAAARHEYETAHQAFTGATRT